MLAELVTLVGVVLDRGGHWTDLELRFSLQVYLDGVVVDPRLGVESYSHGSPLGLGDGRLSISHFAHTKRVLARNPSLINST